MTGFFFRVERDGQMQNVEWEHLTQDEFLAVQARRLELGQRESMEFAWSLARGLGQWIKEHVKEVEK